MPMELQGYIQICLMQRYHNPLDFKQPHISLDGSKTLLSGEGCSRIKLKEPFFCDSADGGGPTLNIFQYLQDSISH